ncbi:MAG: Lrp/AsnC family transcriptional regulator [Oscillospiraceae bacterium]|nr:Lrp/AsnC family transcriptional regulator [Oscillospiraceae bacterium]
MDNLLKLLKQNARLSNEQLGIMLGITEDEVAKKIKEYEDKGVIMGYSTILNDELCSTDNVTALIELKVTPAADSGFDDVARKIMSYDEVESVVLMSGGFDLSVTVTASSLKSVAEFVAQRLAKIDGVISTATHFVLKTYKDKGISVNMEDKDERGLVSP